MKDFWNIYNILGAKTPITKRPNPHLPARLILMYKETR